MRTDELVDLLACNVEVVAPDSGARRFAWALGAGALGAALLMAATLGVNPALAAYVQQPTFWLKVVFVAALAAIGLVMAQRLSRPGARLAPMPAVLAMPVLAMWMIGAAALLSAPAEARAGAFFGQTWAVCPLLVAMLAAPVFAGVIWAMKGLAPTRLRLAGAAAGFLSGAVGALVYCLHCPELAPSFIAFWYLLGMLIPTVVGAALGSRLLQW